MEDYIQQRHLYDVIGIYMGMRGDSIDGIGSRYLREIGGA